MSGVDIHGARFTFSCYVYIYLGVAVFFLGWVKAIFSVPALVLLGFCLWKHWKELREEESGRPLIVRPWVLAAAAVFSVLFCLVAGQGGFFVQAGDWEKHNHVLNDLVTSHWPVCYHNDDGEAMLTYYIAQYLVPALCGKAAGSFRVAEIALLIYDAIGIFGVLLLLFRVVRADTVKKQAVSAFVFVFFGTCLFLGKALYGATGIGSTDISGAREWISNAVRLQYRALYTNLRWAFPQAVVPWLATLLFFEDYRDVRLYCLIGAPLLLYATFPFLGLAVLMAGVVVYRLFAEKDRAALFKEVFSPQNVAVAVGFLIPVVYLMGNLTGEKVPEVGFSHIDYGTLPAVYFCFVAAFMVYSVVIFKRFQDDLLFYLVNISLLLFPFFRMGIYNDLAMSGSIPAVFLLMVFVLQALFAYSRCMARSPKRMIVLVLLLAVGAVYPMEEMAGVLKEPISLKGAQAGSLRAWARRDGTVGAAEAYNYFTYDHEESLFYRFFSRREPDEWKEEFRYDLGQVVSFDDTAQDAHRYFTQGVSWTDLDHAWTDGNGAGLYLYIPDHGEENLRLHLGLHMVYDAPQQMIVRCGDEVLFDESIEAEETMVTVPIPADCVREQMLGLTFQFPDAVSPKDLGESEDERRMAFGLRSFVVE